MIVLLRLFEFQLIASIIYLEGASGLTQRSCAVQKLSLLTHGPPIFCIMNAGNNIGMLPVPGIQSILIPAHVEPGADRELSPRQFVEYVFPFSSERVIVEESTDELIRRQGCQL